METNNLIGIVGDLHFYPDVQEPEKWVAEFDRLGDWIVAEFKKRGIRWVVFMGDIFHGRVKQEKKKSVDFRTLGGVVQFFKKFDDFQVIVILGNHDCFHKESADDHGLSIFNKWDNVRVVDRVPKFLYRTQTGEMVFEGENDNIVPNEKFTFVPWGTEIKDIPKADAVFGHFDIQSFKYNAHKTSEHGFKSEQLFRRSKNVISGHYHHYQTREYKKGDITYVGTPLQMNWGEADKESYIWVFDTQDQVLSERIENTFSPKHIKVNLSDLMEKNVKAADIMPHNKVRLHIDKEIDKDKIEQFVAQLGKMKPADIELDWGTAQQFDSTGYEQAASVLDYREVLEDFVIKMDTPDPKVLAGKSLEYYDQTE